MLALKQILDKFLALTGLHINFNKSTMVPMNVDCTTTSMLQGVLACQLGSFPQTYLGLPLSHEKLNLSAFSPLIARADGQLSGWRACLLNPMGRAVLINSVMDSQLTYAMSVLPLPPGAIEALNRRRRCFLWSGEDTMSGAQCFTAKKILCRGGW